MPDPDRLPTVDDVTSPEAWNSERLRGFAVTLPSGNTVFVKRTMDLLVLLKAGRIPNPLADAIQKQIDTGSPNFNISNMDEQALEQLLELIDHTVVKMVIKPPVALVPEGEDGRVWQPPEGHISIADFSPDDRFFLFQISQGGVTDLTSFRKQQEDIVSHLADGGSVRDEAVSTAGDS